MGFKDLPKSVDDKSKKISSSEFAKEISPKSVCSNKDSAKCK